MKLKVVCIVILLTGIHLFAASNDCTGIVKNNVACKIIQDAAGLKAALAPATTDDTILGVSPMNILLSEI